MAGLNCRVLTYRCTSIIFLSLFTAVGSLTGQDVTGNFTYSEPCGCGGVVDLTIYNGLYGSFGGQQVSDSDEESLGAITIANLNDTDNDGNIDNADNYIANAFGRTGEIDLSRLTISLTGAVAPTCEFVEITLSSSIRLWDNLNKGNQIPTRIPVGDLPLDVYVEAIAASATLRDQSITVGLLDETGAIVKDDRVVLTAIWLEHTNSYLTRGSTPVPSTLGIDEPSLIHVIDTEFISTDGRRYGYGVFGDPTIYSQPAMFDNFLGGRILHEFSIRPAGLATQLSTYNVHLDVSRRKSLNDRYITHSGLIETNVKPFNLTPELSDDDTNNLDEDLIPSMTSVDKIFSYDVPSIPRQFGKVFAQRSVQFEEFVRVSFSTPPGGNSQTGGICSSKVDWELAINAAETGSRNMTSPNNADDIFLTETTSTGLIATRPKIPTLFSSNGVINTTPLSTSNPDGDFIFLTSSTDSSTGNLVWQAVSRPAFGASPAPPSTPLGTSNISAAGPWVINSPLVNITINNNPAMPYVPGTQVSFFLLNINSTANFIRR